MFNTLQDVLFFLVFIVALLLVGILVYMNNIIESLENENLVLRRRLNKLMIQGSRKEYRLETLENLQRSNPSNEEESH